MTFELKKKEQSKLDWTLIPWLALEGAARVMQSVVESGKYPRDNWQDVSAEDHEAASLRHRMARIAGEEYDPESGLPHIDHELSRLLFARWHYAVKEKADKGFQRLEVGFAQDCIDVLREAFRPMKVSEMFAATGLPEVWHQKVCDVLAKDPRAAFFRDGDLEGSYV